MEISQTPQTKFIILILKQSPLPNNAALHLLSQALGSQCSPTGTCHQGPDLSSCVSLTTSSVIFIQAQTLHNTRPDLGNGQSPGRAPLSPVSLNSPKHSSDCGVFHMQTPRSSLSAASDLEEQSPITELLLPCQASAHTIPST